MVDFSSVETAIASAVQWLLNLLSQIATIIGKIMPLVSAVGGAVAVAA